MTRARFVLPTDLMAARALPPTTIVTTQYRERDGMAYELSCPHGGLCIRVFPAPNDRPLYDASRWRVEARTSDAPDALVVTAWGHTRRSAVEAVASWWDDEARKLAPLPNVDWDEVVGALERVQAIR